MQQKKKMKKGVLSPMEAVILQKADLLLTEVRALTVRYQELRDVFIHKL